MLWYSRLWLLGLSTVNPPALRHLRHIYRKWIRPGFDHISESVIHIGGSSCRATAFISWGKCASSQRRHAPTPFAPTQWINGSSYAHLDESAFPQGTANALMTPYLNNGEVLHSPGAVTIGIFRDVGWNVSSAPELEPLPSFMLLIEIPLYRLSISGNTWTIRTPAMINSLSACRQQMYWPVSVYATIATSTSNQSLISRCKRRSLLQ